MGGVRRAELTSAAIQGAGFHVSLGPGQEMLTLVGEGSWALNGHSGGRRLQAAGVAGLTSHQAPWASAASSVRGQQWAL